MSHDGRKRLIRPCFAACALFVGIFVLHRFWRSQPCDHPNIAIRLLPIQRCVLYSRRSALLASDALVADTTIRCSAVLCMCMKDVKCCYHSPLQGHCAQNM